MVLKQLAKDSAIYGGADLLSKTISFFTFPIIAAALSPEAFGFLELIVTSTALLGVIGNMGLNNSVQRYYWDSEVALKQRPVIVTSGLFSQIGSMLIFFVLGIFAVIFLRPMMKAGDFPFTLIGLLAALVLMASNQWTQYTLDIIRLHFKPWRFLTISMTSRVLSAIAGVLMVVSLGLGIDGLLVAQATVVFLILPFAFYMIRKELGRNFFNWEWAKELIKYGYPFIFSAMAFWLFTSQDRWMLASMSSVEEVGIYSVAFRFASIIFFVSAAFGQAWSPVAIKIRTDNPDNYRKIYGDVLLLLLFFMLAIAGLMAMFSGEILELLMKGVYSRSAIPLAILCFAIVFQASQQITGIGISLEKKSILFAHLSWITTALNFILNWFLIPYFGAIGAAWATAISYLFLTGAYLFFTQRLHPMKVSWSRLIGILSLGAIVGIIALFNSTQKLQWEIITWKLSVAIGFIILGALLLPLRGLKNV